MSERERQRRAYQSARDQASYTLDEWCERRRISRAMFYKLDRQGLAPSTYYVGGKRCISSEADLAWLRALEADSSAAA